MHDEVDEQKNGTQDVQDDEEASGVCGTESTPALEGCQRDEESYGEHDGGARAQQPDGERSAIFKELEADEAINHEGDAGCRGETVLDGNKVRISTRARGSNTSVED